MRDAINWAVVLAECGVARPQIDVYAPLLADQVQPGTFSLGDQEIPAFLGQILHESDMLRRTQENLRYSAARIRQIGNASGPKTRWRSLVARADELANKPQALANAAYGGRGGNGPEASGDGWRYHGRGLIQATFRENYALLQRLTGLPLLSQPDLLLAPAAALDSAVKWWEHTLPDAIVDDPELVTLKVNGGLNGYAHRAELTARAEKALAGVTA